MTIIIIVCNIPYLILAFIYAIWRWDSEPLSAFVEGIFDSPLDKSITKNWK